VADTSCKHPKRNYRTRDGVTRCSACGEQLAHQVTLLPDHRVSKQRHADALARAETEATPSGEWPRCPAHPDVPMFWHPRGWGWQCVTEQAEGKASPQPYALAGSKSVTVDPKGLKAPGDVRARPNQKAYEEADRAKALVGDSTTRQQRGWEVKGKRRRPTGNRPRR
jgi:hypothetical protein